MILLMVMVVMMVIVIMMMMITLMKMVIMIKMIVMMMMMVIIRCGGAVYQAEQVLTRAGPCHLLCLACNHCG